MKENQDYVLQHDLLYAAQRERTLADYKRYFPPEAYAPNGDIFLQSLLIVQASGASHGTTFHTVCLELPGDRGRMKGIGQFIIRQNKHPKAAQYFFKAEFLYANESEKEKAVSVAKRALPEKMYPQAGKNNQALLKAARAATLAHNTCLEPLNIEDGLRVAVGMYDWKAILVPPSGWVEPTQAQFQSITLPFTQYLEEVQFRYQRQEITMETPTRWQLPEAMQFAPCATFADLFTIK